MGKGSPLNRQPLQTPNLDIDRLMALVQQGFNSATSRRKPLIQDFKQTLVTAKQLPDTLELITFLDDYRVRSSLRRLATASIDAFAASSSPLPRDEDARLRDLSSDLFTSSSPVVFLLDSEVGIGLRAGYLYDLETVHILLTQSALDVLTEAELRAGLAHEFSHITHADGSLIIYLSALVELIIDQGLISYQAPFNGQRLFDPHKARVIKDLVRRIEQLGRLSEVEADGVAASKVDALALAHTLRICTEHAWWNVSTFPEVKEVDLGKNYSHPSMRLRLRLLERMAKAARTQLA